ncbi:MAG: cupredoxin domain-containing protein [Chloroflexi bacterium]|nr:cupredoxin domain-containing protein [Chloroflexota bacterium]MBI2982675.1 cupredoxin domain-containing protein [Chloroflexota bacterium]
MRLRTVAAAGGLAFILAACSGGGTAAPAAGAAAITLSEFKYAPGDLQVKAGQPVKLTVKNAGTVEHDFTIDAAGLKVHVNAGQSAERQIKALEPGTYEIYCSIAGHKEAGMKGKLVVSK